MKMKKTQFQIPKHSPRLCCDLFVILVKPL